MRLLALVLSAIFATGALAAETQPKPKAPSSAPAITVVSVRTETITSRVKGSGIVEPVEQVFVQPQIEGQAIETLAVDIGADVTAGQTLATLSISALTLQKSQLEASRASAEASIAQADAQIAEARASANEAQRQADRATTLSGKGIAAKSTADQAKANAESASARLLAAEQGRKAAEAQVKVIDAQIADIDLKLARTDIKAPVGGRVVERNVMMGGIASAAGKPMFVIVRDGKLELRAEIAEQDVMRLKEGQAATLKVNGMDQPVSGMVTMVEPTVSPTTRLGKARISIDANANIRWGVFVDADIVTETKQALVLPLSAVGISNGGASVLLVRDGRVAETKVVTGIVEGEMVEIISGVSEGDVVVAKAGAFVRDGDRINPVMIEARQTASN
jgi:HlyD family secretion protein